jgi:hypothetical protein
MKSFKEFVSEGFNKESAKITELADGWMFRGKKYKNASGAWTAFNKYSKSIAPSIVVLTWDTKTKIGAAAVKAIAQ